MDLRPDPLQAQLRRALRVGLGAVPLPPGVTGPPVDEGRDAPARAVLSELGATLWERVASLGGLELGLGAGVAVSFELGLAALANPYRSDAFIADLAIANKRPDLHEQLDAGATTAVAGWALDVTATPHLTGTTTMDGPSPDVLAVIGRTHDGPVVTIVPGGAQGSADTWPRIIHFDSVATDPENLLTAVDTPLDRARTRQAAYLLGLATGILRAALDHTATRHQFGQRLRDLQGVAFPLAHAVIEVRALRGLVDRTAWLLDAVTTGDQPPSALAGAPIETLALAGDVLTQVTRTSMQACGVRAMTAELPLHRYHRLAAAETTRFGRPGHLWRLAGAARLAAHASR